MGIRSVVAATGLILVAGGLAGCSGGGSSSDSDSGEPGEGKSTPGQLSVVVAKSGDDDPETSGSELMAASSMMSAQTTIADDADYNQDQPEVWVHDVSVEPLEIVNMILCSIRNTGARELVNQDPYLALLNPDQCEQGKNTSDGASDDEQGNELVFEEWVVASEHASADDDHEIQFWLTPNDPDDDFEDDIKERIMGDIRISESASEDRPFGHFEMAFRAEVADGDFEGTPMFLGELSSADREDGSAQFRFRMKTSDDVPMNMDMWANVVLDDGSGDTGRARTSLHESFDMETYEAEYAVAFDESRMLREDRDTGEQFCAARDNFDVSIWRYNLYHANDTTFNGRSVSAGERVRVRSGFPFRTEVDGETVRGHIGYHGLWMDGERVDMDGRTITRGRGESAEEFTVEVIGGRMQRRERDSEYVKEFQGDDLFWYYDGQEYRVTVTAADHEQPHEFYKTHSVEWTDTGPEQEELSDAEKKIITPEEDGERLWLWHDSLGGDVIYKHNDDLPPEDREISFFEESQILAGEGETLFAESDTVTLWCQWECLKGGLTDAVIDEDNKEDWFYDYDDSAGDGPWAYQIDSESLELVDVTDGGTVVSLRGLSIPDDHRLSHGARMDLATDEEDADNADTLAVSYTWDTGPRDYSWRHRVIDSNGDIRRFDEPLRFDYTHSVENDANDDDRHDGRRMMLEYEGRGELHGFPWEKDEDGRWRSPVNLADGTVLEQNGHEFLVKGMEMEQTMKDDGTTGCGDMLGELPNESTLPRPDEPEDNVSFTWDDRPNVDDEPRVIDGELQDD